MSEDGAPAGVGVGSAPLDLKQQAPAKAETDDASPGILDERRTFQLIVQASNVLYIE